MTYQSSFAELDYTHKKRLTRSEVFLGERERTVPWAKLLALIEPAYPTSGRRGRQPMRLARRLRIHCLQNGFSFSARQREDGLYEIERVRRCAGFASVSEALPDDTTRLNCRHELEKPQRTQKRLATINACLKEPGLLVSQGTRVDATLMHAASATQNNDKARAPDRPQTRTGKHGYLGMNIPVGAEVNSGAVHTAAPVADLNEGPKWLPADDRVIFADAAYSSDKYWRGARHPGLRGCVNDPRQAGKNRSASHKKRTRQQASVRARVAHVCRLIKPQSGFQKTRYRGLEKKASPLNLWVGLANLYLLRRQRRAA